MKLLFTSLAVVCLAMAGCRSANSPISPFGQATIPPPSTGASQPAAGGAPYYDSTPLSRNLEPVEGASSNGFVNVSPTQRFPSTSFERTASLPGGSAPSAPARAPSTLPGSAPGATIRQQSYEQELPGSNPSSFVPNRSVADGASSSPIRIPVERQIDPGPAATIRRQPAASASPDIMSLPEAEPSDLHIRPDGSAWRGSAEAPATRVASSGGDKLHPADGGYGHATDYGWLKGRLEYSQVDRRWKLRYIPAGGDSNGQVDQFGGSVVLADSPLLADSRDGDYVLVEGRILTAPDEQDGFAPPYGIERISEQASRAAPATLASTR